MVRRSRLGRLAKIAAIGTFAAACDSTTGPNLGMELDTEAALADYEALDTVLGSAEFAAFRALGGRTPFSLAPGGTFALELVRRLEGSGAAAGPMAAPIISGTHRGATFVYDPGTDDYLLDPDRTGAPETGVRFILYEVDEAGRPIVEHENGHADLMDEGDESPEDIVLHLIVVQNETTVLDYHATLDENENRGELTVRGFLEGDGVRLDFDIEAASTETEGRATLDVAFDIRVDARDFSITGSVRGVEEGVEGEGDIDVTVRHRTESIRLDVRGSEGTIEGTVSVNSDLFATVSGPAEEPTLLGQGGDPLTFGEFLVLRQIFDAIEDVFDFLEDLIDPVDDLVVLGIVL